MNVIEANPTTTSDRAFVIGRVTMFDGMEPEELKLLEGMMEVKVFQKYQFIYRQADAADYIYFLSKGTVKIGTTHPDGREMIKRILHPEAVFGEIGIYSSNDYNNFAFTMSSEVVTYRIEVKRFRRLLSQSNALNLNVLSMIGNRLTSTEKRLESLIFKDARARIIDFLRSNAETRGRKVGYETFFKNNLTQQDIANFTGTSRQTVTSVLNDLRKTNLIYFNRSGILIRDMARLV